MLRGVKYLTFRLYCYTSVTNGTPQLLGKQWGRQLLDALNNRDEK